MVVVLENDLLKVSIKQKGAELFTVFNKKTQLDYMWGGDPAFWGKTSPVLFPIVGALKDNIFVYQEKKFTLTRHGFARDETFEIEDHQPESVVFLLRSTTESFTTYPFLFELRLTYKLFDTTLNLSYEVKNIGPEEMYFSIGGHPAFKVPLVQGSRYEDHYLEFNKNETAGRWPLSNGLIEKEPVPLLINTNILALTRELFYDDALVLKNLQSDMISIKSKTHTHGLDFHFDGFPFLGIWAAPHADFLCIEPWCGIADAVTHNQQLIRKEGIEKIDSDMIWSRTWTARFY